MPNAKLRRTKSVRRRTSKCGVPIDAMSSYWTTTETNDKGSVTYRGGISRQTQEYASAIRTKGLKLIQLLPHSHVWIKLVVGK